MPADRAEIEQDLILKPWQEARPGVQVKLLPQQDEMYVFAPSRDRIAKDAWHAQASAQEAVGASEETLVDEADAQGTAHEASARPTPTIEAGWRLVEVRVHDQAPTFTYALRKDKLREVRRREGRYLLRTNLTASDPAELWRYYIQLVKGRGSLQESEGRLGDPLALPLFP